MVTSFSTYFLGDSCCRFLTPWCPFGGGTGGSGSYWFRLVPVNRLVLGVKLLVGRMVSLVCFEYRGLFGLGRGGLGSRAIPAQCTGVARRNGTIGGRQGARVVLRSWVPMGDPGRRQVRSYVPQLLDVGGGGEHVPQQRNLLPVRVELLPQLLHLPDRTPKDLGQLLGTSPLLAGTLLGVEIRDFAYDVDMRHESILGAEKRGGDHSPASHSAAPPPGVRRVLVLAPQQVHVSGTLPRNADLRVLVQVGVAATSARLEQGDLGRVGGLGVLEFVFQATHLAGLDQREGFVEVGREAATSVEAIIGGSF
jgi:hypothetical protein